MWESLLRREKALSSGVENNFNAEKVPLLNVIWEKTLFLLLSKLNS